MPNTIRLLIFILFTLTLHLIIRPRPALAQAPLWQDVAESTLRQGSTRLIIPKHYRLLQANMTTLDATLAEATRGITLTLPLPDGREGLFWIEADSLMQPDLAAKFPEIQTYRGRGLSDKTATVWLDRTPNGFHGLILSAEGTVYLDPYRQRDITYYISYYQRDFAAQTDYIEILPDNPHMSQRPVRFPNRNYQSGDVRRTYRLAVATTGEYAQFYGGTITQTEAGIVTTINRVRGIYERELSLSFTLVDNTAIIFTNPLTDPYDNTRDDIYVNQDVIDERLGNANYDVGHLVGTGGGGSAGRGVCINSLKAQGLTGQPNPIGDPFDVDYVAHELGHQFDASHTFNAKSDDETVAGRCNSGNWSWWSPYEPGSGSTIMAYTGICKQQDLQPHSDAYFHPSNFEQIRSYVTENSGRLCGTVINTGNTASLVEAGPDITISVKSSFNLIGSAQDAEGDALTYSWEEMDMGQGWTQGAILPNTDPGYGPLFRSYPPMTSPRRSFPNPDQPALAAKGEFLPTTARKLQFRLTVRDGRGGVSYDDMTVTVINVTPTPTVTSTITPTSTATVTPSITPSSTPQRVYLPALLKE